MMPMLLSDSPITGQNNYEEVQQPLVGTKRNPQDPGSETVGPSQSSSVSSSCAAAFKRLECSTDRILNTALVLHRGAVMGATRQRTARILPTPSCGTGFSGPNVEPCKGSSRKRKIAAHNEARAKNQLASEPQW